MNDPDKQRRVEIGKRIIEFRESKGLDQTPFLSAILEKVKNGITQGNLSHWEIGRYEPSYSKLKLIQKAFPDFDPDVILYGPNAKELIEAVKLHPRSQEETNETNGKKGLIEASQSWVLKENAHLHEIIKLQNELIKELRGKK